MNSQIVINIDSQLKEKAVLMAKEQGMTMKALLSMLLDGYVKKDIKLGANSCRNYPKLEYEEWSEDELNILESNKNLKSLSKDINKLLKEKGICK